MKKYFKEINNVKELKKAYFKYVKEFHTDNGGDKDKFVEMKNEYEQILKNGFDKFEDLENGYKESCKKHAQEFMKKYAEVLEKIIILENVDIEIIGDWIWVGGATYPHKDILKENKFFFSKSKKKWYWNGDDKKINKRSKMSLNDIKNKYGCTKVENKKVELLTC